MVRFGVLGCGGIGVIYAANMAARLRAPPASLM
jgi:hypothetical protein